MLQPTDKAHLEKKMGFVFLLPNIKAFFDSDEGKAEFAKWKAEQNCQKATSEKMEKSGEKSPL